MTQKNSFSKIDKKKVDIIFNALHGEEGEDGLAQSFFEFLKIPYTHSGVLSSMNAMNKEVSKKIFLRNNIKTPKYVSIYREDYNVKKMNLIIKNFSKYPLVVKPLNEGSSIGVKIVKNFAELKTSINLLFRTYKKLLIEKYIGGQEIQVAVINGKALGAIELIPKRKFYDYKAKIFKISKNKSCHACEYKPWKI